MHAIPSGGRGHTTGPFGPRCPFPPLSSTARTLSRLHSQWGVREPFSLLVKPLRGWPAALRHLLLLQAGDVEPNPGPTDDWQLRPELFRSVVQDFQGMGCPQPYVDAFAAPHNALLPRFWTREDDAFRHCWWALLPIWANPPFDVALFGLIRDKILQEGGHLLLLCPGWRSLLPVVEPLARAQVRLPLAPLFLRQGRYPADIPGWPVFVFWIQQPPPPRARPPLVHAGLVAPS